MKRIFITGLLVLTAIAASAKEYKVKSPDGRIEVCISDSPAISWKINYEGQTLVNPSRIAMKVKGGEHMGIKPAVRSARQKTVETFSEAVVPSKFRTIHDHYNELVLDCRGGYAIAFRAYNNGAAYRFETSLKGDILIEDETFELDLAGDFGTYWPNEQNADFITHCEAFFQYTDVKDIEEKKYAYLPVYLSSPRDIKMVAMEADLTDYPNLFLFAGKGNLLRGEFPPVILESRLKPGADRDEEIVKNADYIARTRGTRTFPWRLVTIDADDRALLENNLVYQLSAPAARPDTDWIKPGKISWEWWNTLNLYGVDFEAGVNTDTYKYFIDFAAEFGIEYILLDEGWSASTHNIRDPRPELDIQELADYGKERNVGLVLWGLWNPLAKDIEGILDVYESWGIRGIKIDFMQRSDQDMVNFYEAVAKAAFDRRLLVDFHGSFKPSGLHRTWPNVMTYEGVYGMEHNKCSYDISPNHDLVLPFTRMVAGPMDYTPGATVNAVKSDFREHWDHPMSQGTRAHQAAIFIAFESPLQMLCDSPSHYYREREYTGFIASIPTVWDETKALSAKAGEHLAIARRNGDTWYVAGLTNWDSRQLTLQLDFLGEDNYEVEIFRDGANSHRYGSDYKYEKANMKAPAAMTIDMAPGGGWAAIFKPIK